MRKLFKNLQYRICLSLLLCLLSSNVFAQEILDKIYEEELGLNKQKEILKTQKIIDELKLNEENLTEEERARLEELKKIQEKNRSENPDLVDTLENNMSKILLKRRKLQSLMYNLDEEAAINSALDSLRSGGLFLPKTEVVEEETLEEEIVDNRKSYVYLGSILYYGEGNWALWINGQKFTSDSNSPENEIYIKAATYDEISVLWTISASKWRILLGRKADEQESKINANNQVETEFKLKPNQTYLLKENRVIEGKVN